MGRQYNMGVDTNFGLIVCKVAEDYIVLYEGAYDGIDNILGVIEECFGANNVFKVQITNKKEYNNKKKYVNILNEYIEDILNKTL